MPRPKSWSRGLRWLSTDLCIHHQIRHEKHEQIRHELHMGELRLPLNELKTAHYSQHLGFICFLATPLFLLVTAHVPVVPPWIIAHCTNFVLARIVVVLVLVLDVFHSLASTVQCVMFD